MQEAEIIYLVLEFLRQRRDRLPKSYSALMKEAAGEFEQVSESRPVKSLGTILDEYLRLKQLAVARKQLVCACSSDEKSSLFVGKLVDIVNEYFADVGPKISKDSIQPRETLSSDEPPVAPARHVPALKTKTPTPTLTPTTPIRKGRKKTAKPKRMNHALEYSTHVMPSLNQQQQAYELSSIPIPLRSNLPPPPPPAAVGSVLTIPNSDNFWSQTFQMVQQPFPALQQQQQQQPFPLQHQQQQQQIVPLAPDGELTESMFKSLLENESFQSQIAERINRMDHWQRNEITNQSSSPSTFGSNDAVSPPSAAAAASSGGGGESIRNSNEIESLLAYIHNNNSGNSGSNKS